MSNYVLKYKRGDEVKYISHLDFIRFIQRVMRRAGLLMEFSQGFNPHPKMAVALPLSVGVTADGELMRIAFLNNFDENELRDIINNAFPRGFEIVDVKKVEGKEIDFAKINRAVYTLRCEVKGSKKPDIEAFLKNDEIKVMKKSKSGVKEANIRPHIHNLEIISHNSDETVIKMCLDAGNLYNLKPDTVVEAMNKYIDDFEIGFYLVNRDALLSDDKELM